MRSATACVPTARPRKATSTSIATRNFTTSTIRPRRSFRRRSRSSRCTPKRRNWWAISRTTAGRGAPNVHDFIDPKFACAVPYGVHDICNNSGWVSVSTDHDTASFAVRAIGRWWKTKGKKRHPNATQLMDHRRWRRQQRLSRAPYGKSSFKGSPTGPKSVRRQTQID
ncbi:MAG: hypothetical protein JNK07_18865 [Alphaproteobacteria bacterium]|nr:hypothetical protein [Alphaproteobacteria bacterium]